jgi:5'-deoxynucleotidase YfbR-like HD superfamily hydrolase
MNGDYRDIFLSHSSKDKPAVEKLANDLKAQGASVWFDAWEIPLGASLVKEVERGLLNSKFIGIWITKNAISSGWVEKEWQTRLKDEIEKGHVIVLPLLAENCELPYFLRDKLYADFTSNYDKAFEKLLETLQIIPRSTGRKILAFTKDIIDDLSEEVIPLPLNGKIKIVETLKRMPRSGKLVRLKKYEPKLIIRSIYDHILSVAYSADCLFPHINHGIKQQEISELARCIAFHELNEVILGDMPAYTNLSESKIRTTDLYAWKRLKDLDKKKREYVANEFISMFLGERERKSLQKVNEYFQQDGNPIADFMSILDKIDPIINIWRYLHQYRGKLDPGATNFLRKTKDFFDYPEVKEHAENYSRDHKIYNLVLILQDRDLAKSYYDDRKVISNSSGLFSLPQGVVCELIEGRNIMSTIERGSENSSLTKRSTGTPKGAR